MFETAKQFLMYCWKLCGHFHCGHPSEPCFLDLSHSLSHCWPRGTLALQVWNLLDNKHKNYQEQCLIITK